MRPAIPGAFACLLAMSGCGEDNPAPVAAITAGPAVTAAASGGGAQRPLPTKGVASSDTTAVTVQGIAAFRRPWAMVFLPDGRLLVTEREGRLQLTDPSGAANATVRGVPGVVLTSQGGLLDVALDPDFAANRRIYLSYTEAGENGTGLAVSRGTLGTDASGGPALSDQAVIWRQIPKDGDGRHFGGRMAFAPDGRLFIAVGERHAGSPAQDLAWTFGKMVRIERDGSIPADNPFVATAGARPDIWSLGHRNPYGLVFGADGRLYESEMGPDAGDEFNIIAKGANYGWRLVSEGSDGGEPLPPHAARPDLSPPAYFWAANIAPAGMIQYTGTRFTGWTGDFVLSGLVYFGLVQVRVEGAKAREVRRIPLGSRIREIEQGPDGLLWVLEDGAVGRLLKLTPA